MNSAVVLFALAAVAVVAVQGGYVFQCPFYACLKENYDRNKQYSLPKIVVYDQRICNKCNKLMDKDQTLNEDGCPIVPCTTQAIPPGCALKTYFVWEDRLCPDCPEERLGC